MSRCFALTEGVPLAKEWFSEASINLRVSSPLEKLQRLALHAS
jgi:hypothetical protein